LVRFVVLEFDGALSPKKNHPFHRGHIKIKEKNTKPDNELVMFESFWLKGYWHILEF